MGSILKKKKSKKKSKKQKVTLNLPQRWNEFNNSPPWCRLAWEVSFVYWLPEKKIKNMKKWILVTLYKKPKMTLL